MLVVCNTREDGSKAAWYVDQLIARGTDGIILIAQDQHDPSGAPIPRIPTFPPIVVIDWPTAPDPVVFFDMEGAGCQAAAHLVEHGHERIGVITPPIAPPSIADTHTGIHQAFSDASLTLESDYVAHVPDFSTQSGIEGAEQLLALNSPPTAILALGDQLAIGVIQAANSHGLNIPTDLALVSFGDIAVAPYLDPPLTTIHQDAAAAGTAATQMLLQLINNEPPDATRILLPANLIARRSCGCPAKPIPPPWAHRYERSVGFSCMTRTDDLDDPAAPDGQDVLAPPSRAYWREWLAANADRQEGLWVVYRKKSSRLDGPDYDDMVEEALCFAWIDSRVRRVDDDRMMQWFSPRRAGGLWSALNKERIERLTSAGRMTEIGQAVIDQAKADGSWSQLNEVDALIVPPDLQAALDGTPGALTAYQSLGDSAKRQYLWWIHSAKRPATRTNRIKETIRGLLSDEANGPG